MHDDIVLVRDPVFLKHRADEPHVEGPQRLLPILKLFEDPVLAAIPHFSPRELNPEIALKVHQRTLWEVLQSLRGKSGWIDPDTYYGKESVQTASLAAGAAVEAAEKIVAGDYRRGFVMIRPPGHHATPSRAMGFCLFNNVALAAHAILTLRPNAKVAIVDFDLHHGNGTQDAFYDDSRVLFLSSHRYPYYPGTGALPEVGIGKGKGLTINFPLDRPYGDDCLLSVYGQIVMPMLKAFGPDFILVSAGYDGHRNDPMAGLTLSTEAYEKMTQMLIAAAEMTTGKILFCLEGGYNPDALAESVRASLRALVESPRAAFPVGWSSRGEEPQLLERFTAFHKPFFPEIA